MAISVNEKTALRRLDGFPTRGRFWFSGSRWLGGMVQDHRAAEAARVTIVTLGTSTLAQGFILAGYVIRRLEGAKPSLVLSL
jgi:hypothetical protein